MLSDVLTSEVWPGGAGVGVRDAFEAEPVAYNDLVVLEQARRR